MAAGQGGCDQGDRQPQSLVWCFLPLCAALSGLRLWGSRRGRQMTEQVITGITWPMRGHLVPHASTHSPASHIPQGTPRHRRPPCRGPPGQRRVAAVSPAWAFGLLPQGCKEVTGTGDTGPPCQREVQGTQALLTGPGELVTAPVLVLVAPACPQQRAPHSPQRWGSGPGGPSLVGVTGWPGTNVLKHFHVLCVRHPNSPLKVTLERI